MKAYWDPNDLVSDGNTIGCVLFGYGPLPWLACWGTEEEDPEELFETEQQARAWVEAQAKSAGYVVVPPSRAYTREEMQRMFLSHLQGIAKYWATRPGSAEYILGGAMFSFLSTLDGVSSGMPAFEVIPSPDPSDEDCARSDGRNFWPSLNSREDVARLGIHGGSMLHELLHELLDPTNAPEVSASVRTFPKYPSIALLSRRPEIFDVKEVIATEKLHGSNLRLHFPCGMTSLDDIQYGSRDTILGQIDKFPLNNAVEWCKARPDMLTRIWEVLKEYGFSDATIFGEAFGPGMRAKGVKYSDGQDLLFRAFDIMVGENFLTYDLFCEVATKMGLPRVPEVWRGPPTQEALDSLLERTSTVGQQNGIADPSNISEGVVVRSNPLLRNVFGEWLIAKHKSKKFSEVAHAPEAKVTRGASPVDAFVAAHVTEGRVANAIDRLHDRGAALKNTMADMPVLLTEMVADLHKECGPELLTLQAQDKQLVSAVSKVLGPIYRELIRECE